MLALKNFKHHEDHSLGSLGKDFLLDWDKEAWSPPLGTKAKGRRRGDGVPKSPVLGPITFLLLLTPFTSPLSSPERHSWTPRPIQCIKAAHRETSLSLRWEGRQSPGNSCSLTGLGQDSRVAWTLEGEGWRGEAAGSPSLLMPAPLPSPLQMLQPQFKSHNTNEVLEKLFQIVPGENPYRFRDPQQCRRCAVVGNSGNLRGSGYGPDVDGHNFVMR